MLNLNKAHLAFLITIYNENGCAFKKLKDWMIKDSKSPDFPGDLLDILIS